MNWDIIEGNWKQFKGKVKAQWGNLTDDQLDIIAGKRDDLAGKIQETYGISRDEAEQQIRRFEQSNEEGQEALGEKGEKGGKGERATAKSR